MNTRNHLRTLVLGTALALSIAGMPAAHAFAAAPGHTTQPHPIVTGSVTPLKVHSTGEPGQPDEEGCQKLGQNIKDDLAQIKWAAYDSAFGSPSAAGRLGDGLALYQADLGQAEAHCLVID